MTPDNGQRTASLRQGSGAQADSSPNILFVFTDQQSADMMSCAGNGDLVTPAMDALAKRGTRFERAYCAQPLCVPSRGAMSTGLYPHEYGVPFNFHHWEQQAQDGIDWVGKLIGDAGYDTAYYGKWHQPIDDQRTDVHGWSDVQYALDPDLPALCDTFLTTPREKPFFLTVSFVNPHDICEWARGTGGKQCNRPEPPTPADCPELPVNFEPAEGEPDILRQVQAMHPKAYPTGDWDKAAWRQFRWAYARLTEEVDRQLGQTHGSPREIRSRRQYGHCLHIRSRRRERRTPLEPETGPVRGNLPGAFYLG